jgi:hypothetical protein
MPNKIFIITSIPAWHFDIRFLENTIQILVKSIKKEYEEPFGILLGVSTKLRGDSLKLLVNFMRGDYIADWMPEAI